MAAPQGAPTRRWGPGPRTPPPARPAPENGFYLHQPPAGRHLESGAAAFPVCIAAGQAAEPPHFLERGRGGQGAPDVQSAYCVRVKVLARPG